jgi:hydroxyacylglutathione hydrolase
LGPMENYVYFIGCARTKEVAIVDPAWDLAFLRREAKQQGLTITAVLLTHGHFDHVEGLEELLRTHDIPVYLSSQEAGFYTPECPNLRRTADHEIIRIGQVEIECIHTPGHSLGCQCFRCGEILLTGDVLFIDGCGRCDLPGGSLKAMHNSLYKVILKLPDSLLVYPGHNYGDKPFATLSEIKKSNVYLQAADENDFLKNRI